jgi:drug/metabolite transporter (DMT)-like permease
MLALASLWTAPLGECWVSAGRLRVDSMAAVAFLGVFGTGVAFVFMGRLVGRVGSARASFATYLIPVVALVLGVVFRNERSTLVGDRGGAGDRRRRAGISTRRRLGDRAPSRDR